MKGLDDAPLMLVQTYSASIGSSGAARSEFLLLLGKFLTDIP